MTDDAYLVLQAGTALTPGVPPVRVGELACMETPAVRAWLEAQGVTATSPLLRIVAPEETGAVPEGAECLSVPLSEEELSQLRSRTALSAAPEIERQLSVYRTCADDRDALLARALAAGVPVDRVAALTGEDAATVRAAAD